MDGAHSHAGKAVLGAGVLAAVAAAVAAVVVVLLAGRFLLDVVSLHGLGYTLGLTDGTGLLWPGGVRLAYLALTIEGAVAVSAYYDWREADLEIVTWRHAWRVAHLTAPRRAHRRIAWWVSVVRVLVAHQRRVLPPEPPLAQVPPVEEPEDARVLPIRKEAA